MYCSKCGSYLLDANATNVMVTCSECESVLSCSDMVKNGCTFLIFPLKSQLQTMFKKMHLWEHMTPDNCDIAEGTEYKKLNSVLHNQQITFETASHSHDAECIVNWKVQAANGHSVYTNRCRTGKFV